MDAVLRKNPNINEFVDMMDQHLLRHNGNIQRAWMHLGKAEEELINEELEHCVRDSRYYMENYHVVMTENEGLKTLYPFWDSQEMIHQKTEQLQRETGFVKLCILKARQLGSCLRPDTPVLTADLRWIPLEEVEVGMRLVSVDEGDSEGQRRYRLDRLKARASGEINLPLREKLPARKLRTATVEVKAEVFKPSIRLTMENGEELIATGEHRFLCKRRGAVDTEWRRVGNMKVGDEIRFIVHPWDSKMSYEDGWFGGILDGEGSLRAKHGGGCEASVSQVENGVLKRARNYLSNNGFCFREEVDRREVGTSSKLGNRPVHKLVLNSFDQITKLIGRTRPSRFVNQQSWWEGKELPGKGGSKSCVPWSKIVKMDHLPSERMIDLQTSTKTFIARGFVSHNSTYCQGRSFHRTIFTGTTNTLIVAQDPGQADYLFSMSRLAFDSLPWWMRPEDRYQAKGRFLVLDRKDDIERQMHPGLKSNIFVEAANKMCLIPGTMVPTRRGVIAIETVEPGDYVYAPDCTPIEVVAAIERHPKVKTGTKVTAWMNGAFPIAGTIDHPIITENGLVDLSDIRIGEKLFIPFREIIEVEDSIPSPALSEQSRSRLKHIPNPRANREWGFLCGLYLAEGSVDAKNGHPVQLSLSAEEDEFAKRFAKTCGVPFSGPICDGGSRVYKFHSSWLGTWLAQEFGLGDRKRIPDWVYTCGEQFCYGLLEGMVWGDGHFCKNRNDVIFVTSRVTLAVGIRDLALSLGLGLGAINKVKSQWKYQGKLRAGIAYRVEFGGEVGFRTRRAIHAHTHSVIRKYRNAAKWGRVDGENKVWVKVRKVEDCELDVVYDIQVDSSDHLYLLPAAITHNTGVARGKTIHCAHMSELASWMDGGMLSQSIMPTMNANDGIYVMESTAEGRHGFWYSWWKDTVDGKTEWEPLFIEYFRVKKYSKPIKEKETFKLTEEELSLRDKIKKRSDFEISDETFNWVRGKKREFIALEGDEWKFYQEYPVGWMEAFQGSGQCAFPKRLLQKIMEGQCADPRWYGEIYFDLQKAPRDRIKLVLNEVKPNLTIPPADFEGGRLRVWEMPEPGGVYYLAVDVAHGVDGGDFSVCEVLKIGHGMEPDVQVAEWHGWINPTPLAYVAAGLGYWYNEAQIAVECNDVGMTTNNELFRIIEYENMYRWKHIDKIKNFITDLFGWWTNSKTRDLIIAKGRESIMDRSVVLRSEPLLDEMMDFSSEEGGRFEGQDTNDDRVMSFLICRYCAHESDYGKEAAPRSSVQPRNEQMFYVFDNLNRLRKQTTDKSLAEDMVRSQAGWSLRAQPMRRDFANSDFSPVHDKPGIRQKLHYQFGIPAEAIKDDLVLYYQMAAGPTADEAFDVEEWKRF